MYKSFLDETGDHSLNVIDNQYPIFILVSCIFEENYYNDQVIAKFDRFKNRYFGNTNVVLHNYDIKKQKGTFKILADKKKRIPFYRGLHALISSLQFNIIASVIMKKDLKRIRHKLTSISSDPYEMCFEFFLERYVMLMQRRRNSGDMSFESRDDSSNMKLMAIYERYKKNGSSGISNADIKKRIISISFPAKSANIAGHQVADMIASAIARRILHPDKENRLYEAIKSKFVRGKDNVLIGCGLKIFPRSDRYLKAGK